MFNRRHFLAGATLAGLAAPAILRAEGGIFREVPFSLGVAAGDPASDGFVIWTRLAPEPMERHGGMPLANFPVDWEVATDSGFRDVVAKGTELARPERVLDAQRAVLEPFERAQHRAARQSLHARELGFVHAARSDVAARDTRGWG